LFKGHFRRNPFPTRVELSWQELSKTIAQHLNFSWTSKTVAWSYNVLQRLAYLFVIFILFPVVIWTGLALSPAIASAFPASVCANK